MSKNISMKQKNSVKTTKNTQYNRFKYYSESTSGRYRKIYDDSPPKMLAPPPPAPSQATKFNSKLLPFDSTVDLSDQDLDIIKFDKQIFRSNFILREFLRNSQTTVNNSKNFPIYENLCRGCGYGLFEAKGNLCKFCQYVYDGYIKDYSRNLTVMDKNECDKSSEGIYENLCENCGKIVIDGICPTCSKLKSKTDCKPIKSKRFFHGIMDTLKRAKSRNSSEKSFNEISKKLNGEKCSLSSLLSFSVSQTGPKTVNGRKIEIIHNVDGYDNVFKTQDTFDLKKICELKNNNNIEPTKEDESPYGKLKKSDLSLDSSQPRTLLRNGKLFRSNKDNIKRSKSSTTLNQKVNVKNYDRDNKTLEYRQNKKIKLKNDFERNAFDEVFSLIKIPPNTLEWMSSIRITTIDYQSIADDSINSNKIIPSRNYCDCCTGNKHMKISADNLSEISSNSIVFINNLFNKNSSISTERFMVVNNSDENNLTEPLTHTMENLPVLNSDFYDSQIKFNNIILQVDEYNNEYNDNINIAELQYMIEEFKRNLIEKRNNHSNNSSQLQILHKNIYKNREEHCEMREIEIYTQKESSRSKRKAIYLYDQQCQSDNNNLNEVLQYNINSNEYLLNENNNKINPPQFSLKLIENGSNILRIKNNQENNNNCTEKLLVEQSPINYSNNNNKRNGVCEKSSSDSEFVRDLLTTFDKYLKKDYYTINNDVNESELKNPDIDNASSNNLSYYQDFENLLRNANYNYCAPTLSNNNYFVNKVKNPIIEQLNLKNLIISVTLSKCLNKIIISYDKNLYVFLKFIQNSQVHSKWSFDNLVLYYKKFTDLCEQNQKLKIMKKEILPNNFIKLNQNNIKVIYDSYNNNSILKLNMNINNENNNNNNYENINKSNKMLQHDNIYENVEQSSVYENFNLNQISNNEKEKLLKLGNSSLPIYESKFKPIALARSTSESTVIKSNSLKSLLPPIPPLRQNSVLTTKQEIQCNPSIKIERNSDKDTEAVSRGSKPKISNRYGKIFHQLEEEGEEEDSNYGKITQFKTKNDETYGRIKKEEHSYGKIKPIPAPRKLSDPDTRTEVYVNIPVNEKKYKISRKAPAPPLRSSSTKSSNSPEILDESKQLEQNIYSVPNKEPKNQKENNDDGIYQPIWQFKTLGNPRESYQSSCFNSDITESANESSYNDHNEWETDDEFMFSIKTPNNAHKSNNITNIDNNNYTEKPKIVVNDDNISIKSSLSTTSTITGDKEKAGANNTGNQIIHKNSIKNTYVNTNPYRIVCILYSPFNQNLRAFIHDYQNILNNSVNELFKSSSQLSLNSLKTNNNDSDIISITSQTSSTKSIASNSESSPPLPTPCRKISGKRKPPNNSPRLANKLFIPDSVHAWKFMLLDINYCDDEEDLYISEDEILKLKEIEHLPINAPLQRFKSVSSDNLLDIPAQDKKSIGERFRNKLQRGVLKLNPKQIKETKKSKQLFRPIERSSLYLDDGIKPKYPIFGATLDEVEKDTCDCNVPRFIVVCITLIQQKDLIIIDGIYRASGNKMIIDEVKKKLTQSYIFDSQLIKNEDIHTITGLLKLFFRELKTPLIPQEFYHQLPDNLVKAESLAEIKTILNEIPQPNKGTLKYLLKHLTVVAHYNSENRMPASNLAIIWGPCILFADTSGPFDIARMNTLTKVLIENYDFIFGDDERLVM